MSDEPELVQKTLVEITTLWRPGSHNWSWDDEYEDLMGRHRAVTDAVWVRVESEGFGFQDHIAPILLGSDGRVWDGHHRICLAIRQGVQHLTVEVA